MSGYEKPLSAAAMTAVMEDIMGGRLPEPELRDFLVTVSRRGETGEEIAAAAAVLRQHAVPLPLKDTAGLSDTCGTGGDGHGTVNVSTLTALVAASCGLRVVKHGNRAASSKCGSADLLEALGVGIDPGPERVAACLEAAGFCFCFAPRFHPAMKAVGPVRKALGIRTIFNLVGPLANPAPITFQLVGVPAPQFLSPMAEALARLGRPHALVVHGADGLDEISTTGPTDAIEVRGNQLVSRTLDPQAWGLARATLPELAGGDPAHNARLANQILRGEQSPARDLVVANAAMILYLAGKAASPEEGVAAAAQALEEGRTAALLDNVRRLTQG